MKKKAAAVGCVLLALAAVLVWRWYGQTYITVEGTRLRRDITELDLSGRPVPKLEKLESLTALERLDLRDTGLTAEAYENLRAALPGCRILWSVPFQGGYLPEDTAEISVTKLSAEDLNALAWLPELRRVDAADCGDLEMVSTLMAARPDLQVAYSVPVDGKRWRENTQEMTLESADGLLEALPYLPMLRTVTFTGTPPENGKIYALMCAAPEVAFDWSFRLFGQEVNSLDTVLDFTDIPVSSAAELEASLKYFPRLERVILCGSGLPSADIADLADRYPEIRFVWTIQAGSCVLRTDDTTFMPYKFGYDGKTRRLKDEDCTYLKYCEDIICLDLGHMAVTDYSFLKNMTKMQYLVLADTPGEDFSALANLKDVVFLELFWSKFDQPELLTGMTKLEDLNLGYSAVKDTAPLRQMTWLKRLWIPNLILTREERAELEEALPDTIISSAGPGSTSHGWRKSPNYYKMRDLLGMFYIEEA